MKIAVISGGTATNELVSLFNSITPSVSYILPILDNGGSTSELIRVIGGPAIGDIRSRLTRLIPDNNQGLKKLLSFRLSSNPKLAKSQWSDIVDGSHELWRHIEPSTKEIFRAFFIHVNVELLKRSKHQSSVQTTTKQFRYELANVGNLFLTGARLFIGSLDSSIELFMKLSGIDSDMEVLPCINTNFTYHISALLKNGLIITGQSQISHPSDDQSVDYPPPINRTRPASPNQHLASQTNYFDVDSSPYKNSPIGNITSVNHLLANDMWEEFSDVSDDEESGNVPQYTHPELKKSQLHFSKTDIKPLLSPIERIFYVSPYGEEIRPTAHHKVCSTISSSDVVVYSIGSLMTSILPIIVLKGVGKAIAAEVSNSNSKIKKRILFLNGCYDRETFGMDAMDFVRIIVDLATYSFKTKGQDKSTSWQRFVTHLFYMQNSNIHVDLASLQQRGIECVEIKRVVNTDNFDLDDLQEKLATIAYN